MRPHPTGGCGLSVLRSFGPRKRLLLSSSSERRGSTSINVDHWRSQRRKATKVTFTLQSMTPNDSQNGMVVTSFNVDHWKDLDKVGDRTPVSRIEDHHLKRLPWGGRHYVIEFKVIAIFSYLINFLLKKRI